MFVILLYSVAFLEYWRQRFKRLGNPHQSNQEPLVIKTRTEAPSPWNVILSPFSAETLLVDRKGIWPVKSWVLLC